MTRRILAIVIAIFLAALGTAGLLFYAVSADTRAQANVEGVTVAIASKPIPIGTSGARIRADQLIRLERMPRSAVPADALPDVSAELDRLVVTAAVVPGQILLRAMFDEQSKVNSGLTLPDGKMAVTVETGVPEQVAGYVRPGSRVTMFLTYTLLDKDGKETKFQRTRVLLAEVEVLTVGTYQPPVRANGSGSSSTNSNDTTATKASGSLLVTVAVTQPEAERLIEGLHTGKLYLGLLTDAIEVKPGSGVDNKDAAGGVTPLFP